jgi:hypothetical protein
MPKGLILASIGGVMLAGGLGFRSDLITSHQEGLRARCMNFNYASFLQTVSVQHASKYLCLTQVITAFCMTAGMLSALRAKTQPPLFLVLHFVRFHKLVRTHCAHLPHNNTGKLDLEVPVSDGKPTTTQDG